MISPEMIEIALQHHANLRAFLMMIRKAEGTDSDSGYRYLFGSRPDHERLFASYADHPNIKAQFRQTDGRLNWTTAAGAYQFLYRTWDRLRVLLELPDFSPQSQDIAATQLIRECDAYEDVVDGRWQEAVRKCSGTWASLPGGPHQQPTRSWEFVRAAYQDAGGSLA